MTSPFTLRPLLRPLAWGLVLLLVHWTQLSVAAPAVNAAVLTPGPGVHADFVQATVEPTALRADRDAEPAKSSPPKSSPPGVLRPLITAAARLIGTAQPLLPVHQCMPAAVTLKGFDACGPPHLT